MTGPGAAGDLASQVRHVLAHLLTTIGSDGLSSVPNPPSRLRRSFLQVIGHYCLDEGLFALPEAIREMTSMPAVCFRPTNRGVIREGAFADLPLFDYEHLKAGACFVEPTEPAVGIDGVMVNGKVSFVEGVVKARAGAFIHRDNHSAGAGSEPVSLH